MARLTADRALAAGLLKPEAAEALLDVLAEGAAVTQLVHTRRRPARARSPAAAGEVGVVMTMGALHDGHRELITSRAPRCAVVVVTVFLNPLQFAPSEDLSRYPKTLDDRRRPVRAGGRRRRLRAAVDEVYPAGEPQVRVHAGPLGDVLEGASRPGHFDGVLTVVAKLLHLTAPGRRLLRPEGRPAAAADRADGPTTSTSRSRSSRCRPCATPTGSRCPAATCTSPTTTARSRSRCPGRCAGAAAEAQAVPTPCGGPRAPCSTPSRRRGSTTWRWSSPATLTDVPDGATGPALLAVAARVGTTRLIDNVADHPAAAA